MDHARAENRVRFALEQRLEQGRQLFRRILAVAVHQRDEIEAVVDRVAVAELLVAAVALVDRRAQNGDLERNASARSAGRCERWRPWKSRR